ncbi:MAG: hypothetical protein ACREWG_16095 [Gammaproteobacteria bacterium]
MRHILTTGCARTDWHCPYIARGGIPGLNRCLVCSTILIEHADRPGPVLRQAV